MTEEDVRRQQADALLAHRNARTKLEHVRTHVAKVAREIREIGVHLEQTPNSFLPSTSGTVVLTNDRGQVRSQGGSVAYYVPMDSAGVVNIEKLTALAVELKEAEDALSNCVKEASRLGVPV